MRAASVWAAVLAIVILPLILAATSPLLAWRHPIYIAAGFAGIAAMALLVLQPLLIAGRLPRLQGPYGRRAHRWVGAASVLAILIHVGGLWMTSPPDVVDALLLRSPTPFSLWGVIAMWAMFATALIATHRRNLRHWRLAHGALAALIAVTTVVHVALIDGTMEPTSKIMLAVALLSTVGWGLMRMLR